MNVIALPQSTSERLAEYRRRQDELQTAINVTVATAGETLAVPPGWRFDAQQMAFVEMTPPESAQDAGHVEDANHVEDAGHAAE